MKDQEMTKNLRVEINQCIIWKMEWKILNEDALREILVDEIPFQHQVLNVRRMIEEEAER